MVWSFNVQSTLWICGSDNVEMCLTKKNPQFDRLWMFEWNAEYWYWFCKRMLNGRQKYTQTYKDAKHTPMCENEPRILGATKCLFNQTLWKIMSQLYFLRTHFALKISENYWTWFTVVNYHATIEAMTFIAILVFQSYLNDFLISLCNPYYLMPFFV